MTGAVTLWCKTRVTEDMRIIPKLPFPERYLSLSVSLQYEGSRWV